MRDYMYVWLWLITFVSFLAIVRRLCLEAISLLHRCYVKGTTLCTFNPFNKTNSMQAGLMLASVSRIWREFRALISLIRQRNLLSRLILTQSCHRVVGETSRLVFFIGDEVIDIHAVGLHGAQISLDCNHKVDRNIKSGHGCRNAIVLGGNLNDQLITQFAHFPFLSVRSRIFDATRD